MIRQEIEFHPMSELPKNSGYVLLAIRHNSLNDVVMGHWSVLRGFQCGIYPASANTVFCYWAYPPKHPDGEEWEK